MAKVIRLPSAYVITTKVVGVSKDNADGTSRQVIIKENVEEEDSVILQREPENTYDPDAVRVMTVQGKQIGYLGRDVAQKVSSAILNEVEVKTTVSWVSGNEIVGVGLRIELVN